MEHQGNSRKRKEQKRQDGTMSEERKREAFRNAANSIRIDREFREYCLEADIGLSYPTNWDDPLELLGYIDLLGLDENQKVIVRNWTLGLIERQGPLYVWECKLWLKCELKYILKELGGI
jgi:hypothetical protein